MFDNGRILCWEAQGSERLIVRAEKMIYNDDKLFSFW
jgi:hypothetical protein